VSRGTIKKVAGPLVIAEGMRDANMSDVVRVSDRKLIGEIIEIHGDEASIQVYEETSGLAPGAPVVSTGAPMSVELGPGLIGSIYDGIQRPLDEIMRITGKNLLQRGVEAPALKRDKLWKFEADRKKGEHVIGGDILGHVQETHIVTQRIMVPPNVSGTIREIGSKDCHVTDVVAILDTDDGREYKVTLMQSWPVRRGRPYREKLSPKTPLITGQRVIDTLLPDRQGRRRGRSGPVRLRQDGRAAPARQVGRGRHRRLHRLRRARQRNDRRSQRVPRAEGPENRVLPDGAHRSDRQYLRYAGRRP
jgi:V/A-type H+-transporting ATPase subunit A